MRLPRFRIRTLMFMTARIALAIMASVVVTPIACGLASA
jgi:hypothetical protein